MEELSGGLVVRGFPIIILGQAPEKIGNMDAYVVGNGECSFTDEPRSATICRQTHIRIRGYECLNKAYSTLRAAKGENTVSNARMMVDVWNRYDQSMVERLKRKRIQNMNDEDV